MTTKYDWAAAKAAMLDVAARVFGEVPRDRKVRCPFHADGSPSLHVYDDGWHCYGCGEGGDAVDLVARLDMVSKSKALETIIGGRAIALVPRPHRVEERTWDYAPGAEDVPEHPVFGAPSITYRYHRDGQAVGAVARWDLPGGRKEVRPLASVRDHLTGEIRMKYVAMQEPRPLYRPEAERGVLVVVEGEKSAEVLRSRGVEACTWPGGSQAWRKADWSMVTAPKVILWPDADQPGIEAMHGIAAVLQSRGIEVRMVDVEGLPAGHDAADDERMISIARLKAAAPYQSPSKAAPAVEIANHPQPEPEPPKTTAWPFRCLGNRDSFHYFLEHEGQTIVRYSAREMGKSALIELAPLQWWVSMFPKGKDGWDDEAARNALIRESHKRTYTDESQRGRGIWWDRSRIVYHAGSCALIDGEEVRLTAIESQYAYPIAAELPAPGLPLNDQEAKWLILDAAGIPSWHDRAHGHIVAGWTMCAMLAGVIKWRPSIWVQGAAGTGKTSILRDFVARLLGPFGQAAMGNSTEAGIRQRIKCDARPIVLDEAEPQSEADQRRLSGILQLMRQASSDSDALTMRGTASGSAQIFHMRSPFCFGSIQSALQHGADRDRVTLCTLKSAKAGDIDPAEAARIYAEWQTRLQSWPENIHERFLGRAIALAPIARDVAHAMSRAMLRGKHAVDQREADQLGAIMAGAWLLQSLAVPDDDQAADWVNQFDWRAVNDAAAETDAERALAALLGLVIVGDNDRASVSDRVQIISGRPAAEAEYHARVLAWYGLRVSDCGRRLFVSTTSETRSQAQKGTKYGNDLTGLLKQLPGTDRGQVSVGGRVSRGVWVTLP